jgi:predicted permease
MRILRRIGYWLRSRREDDSLREELEFHRAEMQRRLEAGGADRSAAAAQSRRAMGNVTLAREDARDAWAIRLVDVLWRDVRCGVRTLRREPTFALTAMLTLTIGVAATTIVFSVVDAELWKPLPFRNPDRLVEAYSTIGAGGTYDTISGADLVEWRAGAPALEALAARAGSTPRALQRDVTESVSAIDVTWNFFETLGRPPLSGRTFLADDGQSGGIILTDRAWRRLFDGDPSIVGAPLQLDGRPVRVVGIVAAVDVEGPDADIYVPIDEAGVAFLDPAQRTLSGVTGRLNAHASRAEAQAQLQRAADRLAHEFPEGRTGHRVEVQDFRSYNERSDPRPLYFFLAASLFVLALTCVNVAALLLARALKRRSEFAIRGALGGGTPALLRQLVVEGFCLAVPSAAGALLLARWGVAVVRMEVPPDYLWRTSALAVDWRVAMFAFGICILVAIVFGLAPTAAARRIDISSTLGDGARTAGATPAQSRLRAILLTVQIALTVVLVAAAALFLRSFAALTQMPLGFDPSHRISLFVALSGTDYATDQRRIDYAERLQQRARAVPGIENAAIASSSPLMSGPVVRFTVPRQAARAGDEPDAIIRAVGPEYFSLLGIRLIEGRSFTPTDTPNSPRVAIINDVLARRYFRDENPIGRALVLLPGARAVWARRPGQVTIVGVTARTKEVGMNEVDFSDIYVPFVQMPPPYLEVIAKASLPLDAVSAPLRSGVAQIDPRIPVRRTTTLDGRVQEALREDRFHLLVMSAFASLGLLLAATGLYGAVAYSAEQRRREFGIRLALGADGRRLVGLALGYALRIGAIGAAAGLMAALVLGRLVGNALYLVPRVHKGLLFGVSMSDPIALGGAVVTLLIVTLFASAVPARRIASIDPVTSLRQQ